MILLQSEWYCNLMYIVAHLIPLSLQKFDMRFSAKRIRNCSFNYKSAPWLLNLITFSGKYFYFTYLHLTMKSMLVSFYQMFTIVFPCSSGIDTPRFLRTTSTVDILTRSWRLVCSKNEFHIFMACLNKECVKLLIINN